MGRPYPIREIARRAGLSEATVDRVLNRRDGVRQNTVDEVHRAVADLERQLPVREGLTRARAATLQALDASEALVASTS